MKEHPILFSDEMVRALLAKRKTVTRRLSRSWLKVKAGDLLWVRETHLTYRTRVYTNEGMFLDPPRAIYAADGGTLVNGSKYKPSIHMPRWASRITLRATEDARLERLQDITEDEAIAEGCEASEVFTETDADGLTGQERELALMFAGGRFTAKLGYMELWDSLNAKKAPWNSNPEVVRIAFSVQL